MTRDGETVDPGKISRYDDTMIIFRGKRIKLHTAGGMRFGFGYLPHWKTNKDTQHPRQLIAWCGPLILTYDLRKKGWVPRAWHDMERHDELATAVSAMVGDIMQIRIYHENREAWQAQSDRVKLADYDPDPEPGPRVHCRRCGDPIVPSEVTDEWIHERPLNPWTQDHDVIACLETH